ncbi:MAG: 4'-phosphopantetheinyl transferase superfamily protein [Pseudohongiella sp.]|nr:4'-phosphopantetheinyl transferase superfamily protein [Pseudohongiella sp.]MDO9520163.1 4'-phosphopantetheinyl transferase superfamily protein [Pseudohongiella sp.]MDP2125964.1 4'-phosphopantetheinyl transferase superfamily protein [Pseudohongiella sp.]
MISSVAPPLYIGADCRQVSCLFDRGLFQDRTPGELGLALPSTLDGAVQKRKAEFIAGRYCAREALAQLRGSDVTKGDTSCADTTIGIGANRTPLWPAGFVGSITHTHGYASAVVARRSKIRALGLDSETWIGPGSAENVSRQILTRREAYTDNLHLFESPLQYLTVVFSAKESLFKCLFPLVNRFFDFHAAIITPDASGSGANGSFRYELLEDLSAEFCAGFSGYGIYAVDDTYAHTAVMLKV